MTSKSGSIVQIVNYQSGKACIQLDALLPILERVGEYPLAIVSVNGPMRTGKSYLLGHFLRFLNVGSHSDWIHEKLSNEFEWKSSSDRQTTGILVWSEPFHLNKDGRRVAVLLMDTQGSFDEETDYCINYMLFTLSCLLSSVFIYNVQHQVSEDVLQVLRLFLGFSRMTVGDEAFANLVVVIRDWQSPKDYDYGYHDKSKPKEKNFLKDKLEVRGHMAEDVKEVHAEVINSFRSVACCLLPYPGEELAVRGETDNLDKHFLSALEEFVPKVCAAENVVLKTIGGQEITGFLMAEMVKEWDKLFAKIPFDDIKSYASMAAEKQNRMALSTALKAYNKQMDVMKFRSEFTTQGLKLLHDKARREAIILFKKPRKIKNPSIEKEYLQNLETQIETAFKSFREINETLRKVASMMAQSEVDKLRLELKEALEKKKKMENTMKENKKRELEEREKLEKHYREGMEIRIKEEREARTKDNEKMTKQKDEVFSLMQRMKAQYERDMSNKEKEIARLKQDLNGRNQNAEHGFVMLDIEETTQETNENNNCNEQKHDGSIFHLIWSYVLQRFLLWKSTTNNNSARSEIQDNDDVKSHENVAVI